MDLLAEYRILTIPRVEGNEIDARLFDLIAGQRAFWSHVALHLVRDCGIAAEYRVVNHRETSVSLRFHGVMTEEAERRLAQAEAMLPAGYGWRKMQPDASLDDCALRVARVVRRLEFVDLPVASSDLRRGDDGATTFLGVAASDARTRRLPNLDTHPDELMSERFCLPLPGPVDPVKPRLKALFQELQRAAPLIISICLHPLAAGERIENQTLALGFKRFLDPFAGQLASAGFDDVQSLRSAFDRFSLPPGYLAHASLRVAGLDDGAVVGLANMLAASFGGFRAFQVLPPSRDVPGTQLYRPDMDVPGLWTTTQRERQRNVLQRQLEEAGIAPIEAIEEVDFLLRLPHLFTLQEAEELVRLPSADEEGIPGVESQLIPPFVVPNLAFQPVVGQDGQLTPPPANRVRLGLVRRPGALHANEAEPLEGAAWHSIDPGDLTKHAFIVGGTGSGKTKSTLFLAREMARLRIPFMVIEPVKTEYYQELAGKVPYLKRKNFEGDADGDPGEDFLGFDPIRVPEGISVARHASYLKSCFEAAFPMEPVLALLMEKALVEYYTLPPSAGGCGYRKFARGGPHLGRVEATRGRPARIFPSFATLQDFVLGPFVEKEFSGGGAAGPGRAGEMRDIFRRRFENLSSGILGSSFERADSTYRLSAARNGGTARPEHYDLLRTQLFRGPVIVELDAIPDASQKALAMAFLMSYLFEYRQAEDLKAREAGGKLPPGLRHFVIVEEAHRLLSQSAGSGGQAGDVVGQSSQAKSVGLFVDMLAEIRAFGQGLAIVEQIPSKIVSEAVKNTNLKIMLRLPAADDRKYLGEAMSFSEAQQRYVTGLKVDKPSDSATGAVNFVLFEEGVEHPLLLSLPLPRTQKGRPAEHWLYDEFFDERRKP